MGVGGVADAVELEIDVTQSGFRGLLAELDGLRELDAVGRGLHRGVADMAGVANRVQEVRATAWARHRRTAPTSGASA